jgi:hypothetical protein
MTRLRQFYRNVAFPWFSPFSGGQFERGAGLSRQTEDGRKDALIAEKIKCRHAWVVPQFEQCREGLSLSSDEEGEFFVTGVYSYGTRPEQKTKTDEVSRQNEALPMPGAY